MAGTKPELYFHHSAPRTVSDEDRVVQLFHRSLPQPPHQLPPDIAGFTGRQAELSTALSALNQALNAQQRPVVVAIVGQAGVGKSSLAIHLAHQLKQAFGDRQLYVNLRGTENQPIAPEQALFSVLQAWDDAAVIPTGLTARAQLLQTRLAGRTLIVLDNAADAAQVRPLLPQTGLCVVLITSRAPLADLEGAIELTLDPLTELEAIDLLQQQMGGQKDQLLSLDAVHLCGCLPLAIVLFGSMVRQQWHVPFQDMVKQLSQACQRLKPLRGSHLEVRASFLISYQQLNSSEAHLLRCLGLLVDPIVTLPLAAVLLESGLETARETVKQLVALRLLEPIDSHHYRFTHDLIRLFTRGQLAIAETAEMRQAARLRVCRWYLETAEAMSLGLDPLTRSQLAQVLGRRSLESLAVVEQSLFARALHWFETEQLNLLMAIDWAEQAEAWEEMLLLVGSLVYFFDLRNDWQDWEQTHKRAIEIARRLDDAAARRWEAQLLNNLANAATRQQQWDRAKEGYEQSLALVRDLADRPREAYTLMNLGVLFLQQGQLETANSLFSKAAGHLPPDSPAQKSLLRWMQAIHPQQPADRPEERPPRGFFQAIGGVLKRVMGD